VAVTFAARLPFNHRHGNQSICIINHRAHQNAPHPHPTPRGGGGVTVFTKEGQKRVTSRRWKIIRVPTFWPFSFLCKIRTHWHCQERLMMALMKVAGDRIRLLEHWSRRDTKEDSGRAVGEKPNVGRILRKGPQIASDKRMETSGRHV
jgi:hypothetical protein